MPSIEVIAIGTLGTDGRRLGRVGGGGDGRQRHGKRQGQQQGNARKATRTLLVTVAATQQEAERLVHGTQTGALYLALLGDTSVVKPGPGVDNKTLFQ